MKFPTASEMKEISSKLNTVQLTKELDILGNQIKISAERGYNALEIKDITYEAQIYLKQQGYKISSHDDIRQPQDNHYTISWK